MHPFFETLKLTPNDPKNPDGSLEMTFKYPGCRSPEIGLISREQAQQLADQLAALDVYPTVPEFDPIHVDDVDGREFFFEDYALARLLDEEVVHPLHAGEGRILTAVICNDVFAWGCADCEELPLGKIEELYRAWKADPTWGPARWCCVRRNEKPQAPVERDMRKDGAWDDAMEALPENVYERRMREYREAKAQGASAPGRGT